MINGSPTKTQMVDGAGGKSQLAQLTTGAWRSWCCFPHRPAQYMPKAVLATVVFLIGVELVDVRGIRRVRRVRRDEFAVAVVAAAAVVALSIRRHRRGRDRFRPRDLRHSYRPRNSVLVKSAAGHWQTMPVNPGTSTEPGLIIYRFGTSLYFANASRLVEDLMTVTAQGGPSAGSSSTARPSAT